MASRDGGHHRGGRGRGRGRGRGPPNRSSNNDRMCYAFKNTGHCDRGSACRYLHDTTNKSQSRPAVRAQETDEQQDARQSYNAWKRLLGESPTDPNIMRRVWEGALRLLDRGDQDWVQQLPRDLDNDDKVHRGRLHVKALLDTKAVSASLEAFLTNARCFLLTLTHDALLRCLATDTYVGSLYNFFGGVDGKRAVSFIGRVCKALVTTQIDRESSIPHEDVEATLQAMPLALYELLRRERRARFNENIPALIGSLKNVADTFKDKVQLASGIRIARRIADIQALVTGAQELLAVHSVDSDSDASDDGIVSFYPRDLVIPSGRHDNDKKNIADITVFPTRDEIMSDAKDFLPFTDPDQTHFLEDPVQRHIDTYFRLARHDVFGDQKALLAGVMHAVAQDSNALKNPKLAIGDMRVHQYSNAFVSYVKLSGRKGLQAQIAFPQPSPVFKKPATVKQKWWEESRRLDEGSLLSFIWVDDSAVQHIFFVVSEKNTEPSTEYSLVNNNHLAYITVGLATQDLATFRTLMQANSDMAHGVLLEFPGIIPATFVPILDSLKAMQRLNRLPFKEWIVPAKVNTLTQYGKFLNIPAPLYAQTAGFRFPLTTLTKANGTSFYLDPASSCNDEALLCELESKTELDRGQCCALIAALTREFAFIQGPPGTGKSYLGLQLMKVLLEIQKKAELGPILVVCYTNHALDQFLEHLLDIGVQKVVRLGSQSKSPKLKEHNLRNISRSEGKTKNERYSAAMNYEILDQSEQNSKAAFSMLRRLQKHADWITLEAHIRAEHPHIHQQFRQIDDEGFQTAGRHPFEVWKSSGSTQNGQPPIATADPLATIVRKAIISIHLLSSQERGILLDYWVTLAYREKVSELFETVHDVAETQRTLGKIHDESDRRILEKADVIGVTTSGLARKISLLQNVKSKVVICEEAGEVTETHMLSALLPDVEHCIQIGDHEQLRPSVNNFRDLSLESEQGRLHALDKSQFERLSIGQRGRPNMPVAQLNVQRRMRPQVSTLIRETIYEKLIDHRSTINLPDVVGLRKNVFWLDHQNLENEKDTSAHHSKSKSNVWEVAMVQALVRHIVRQGVYSSEDIAVLTPYTGQLQKLRAALRSDFEIVLSDRDQDALEKDGFEMIDTTGPKQGDPSAQSHRQRPLEKKNLGELLRIATVDNFQGEEAKVIIVSLVRSNERRNVGFLKTTNRINVLLSRAKHGMYLIGNADTYASVEMWQKVINMLRATDSVGDKLALCCSRHTGTPIDIQQPEDFVRLSPEGGCREACADRLECGHRCQARCHSTTMHAVFQCEQPCQRRHQACCHPCQKSTCGESCGRCEIKIDNVQLPCGHIKNGVACHLTLDLPNIHCNVKVTKQVPGCKHTLIDFCSNDVTKETFKCPKACETLLSCGHNCPGSCGRCRVKEKDNVVIRHQTCTKKCGRKFGTCTHSCPRLCHDGTECGLCQQPCEVRCKHNRCPQKCHEPCAPCVEPCVWSCEHQGKCKMPCSAPCDRLPCDERCSRILPCGHQCPSVCGESCPADCCQQCGMKSEEQPDVILIQTRYADLDLDDSPIVVLGCGHFFTTETLDGLVSLKDVYTHDPMTGKYESLIENAELAPSVPQCPRCRSPIKQYVTQRYNRIINRAVIDEMSKRFIVNGQQELQDIEQQLRKVETALNGSRKSLVPASLVRTGYDTDTVNAVAGVNRKISVRYAETILLVNGIKALQQRMATHHQPAQKLYQAIIHGIYQTSSLDVAMQILKIDSPATPVTHSSDLRVTYGARLLEIKIHGVLLEDKYEVMRDVRTKYPNNHASLQFWGGLPTKKTEWYLKGCKELFANCIEGSLPKIAVEATLYYARIAQLFGSSGLADETDRARAKAYRDTAKELLEQADKLCENNFRDRDTLLQAIGHATKMLSKEFYETVSKEEMYMIKKAMVSGRGGIATHSGHWYNCVNGHPFAVGECGMPMQLARCPECGEPVGGQNHTPTAGVTRAEDVEG
ncbi:hypothetical protein T440DRAFT_96542 [Plenodomus tracheiphilus IPT5]|uniref:Uncharacterized protein n=1 Tax=Plenodomus tracheiphilus IPT5 TaxID=1408161 RepID=A0A6A7BKK0_9PLEO|nr:hypothetical protein T440DRAFT_96542 [Plenodomus tracheiphilus IPT5]